MTHRYTDKEILDGLQQRKNSCIEFLYREYFPVIRHYLTQNSGNEQDAQDLFQDTIIVLYKRIRDRPFDLACSLKTYFMAISKNLWMQRLENKYRLLYQDDCEAHEEKGNYLSGEQEIQEEELEIQRLFYKNLMSLPTECRRLLQLYCLKVPYREIARMLNYKDEIYVKTRKYSCKKLLRARIMNDPECHKFLKYDGNRNNR